MPDMERIRAQVIAEHRAKAEELAMRDLLGRPILGPSTWIDWYGDTQWVDPAGRRSWDP